MVLPGNYLRKQDIAKLKSADAKTKLALHSKIDERTDRLIRKAIVQAGLPIHLAQNARIEWRRVGYWHGCERVDRFFVPKHLRKFPRLHVRIQFRDENGRLLHLPGPLVLGGGRFYGLGLFAVDRP